MGRYGHPYIDGFKSHCIGTKLKFIFLPRKCSLTGRMLYMEMVYKQTAMYTGPGDPVFEYRYYDKNEFLLCKLKGLV